jgi:hypothetical protein
MCRFKVEDSVSGILEVISAETSSQAAIKFLEMYPCSTDDASWDLLVEKIR